MHQRYHSFALYHDMNFLKHFHPLQICLSSPAPAHRSAICPGLWPWALSMTFRSHDELQGQECYVYRVDLFKHMTLGSFTLNVGIYQYIWKCFCFAVIWNSLIHCHPMLIQNRKFYCIQQIITSVRIWTVLQSLFQEYPGPLFTKQMDVLA